jgi:hypothetical protein
MCAWTSAGETKQSQDRLGTPRDERQGDRIGQQGKTERAVLRVLGRAVEQYVRVHSWGSAARRRGVADHWNAGRLDGRIGVCACGLRRTGGEARGETAMTDGRVGG